MSDPIKHECGIAMVRLLKPLEYYIEKYNTASYGLNKLYLLMEKQHNRGQDGAGIASVKLDMPPGVDYINRYRSNDNQPIKDVFRKVFKGFNKAEKVNPRALKDSHWLKQNVNFYGELLLGHLRYGTHGGNSISLCHPHIRKNNWKTRNLVVAGNFNMTNATELFEQLMELGQHPTGKSDTVTVLEKIGHFLDTEVQVIFDKYKDQGYSNWQITDFIMKEMSLKRILRRASKDFDGGYAMAGMIGHGDSFVLRDPAGIRPAYYYYDDEVVVAASERPCIQTTFKVPFDTIKEVRPGHALIVKKGGQISEEKVLEPKERRSCSFERIYFSRGTDKEIYQERNQLGHQLTDKVLQAVDYDLDNTVFSFIPNTAEVAFYGLMKGMEDYLAKHKAKQIQKNNLSQKEIEKLLKVKPRVEKIAVKDVKMRTFINEDSSRDDLVSHVYDITYGTVNNGVDTLVMVDDSIVRGTTLQKSILSILDRLNPKKIIIVSSAPQIRYPDCYGIDMAKIHNLIAFKAIVQLMKENYQENILQEVYQQCKKDEDKLHNEHTTNYVKRIYDLYTPDEISDKIAEIVRPNHIFSDVQVIYQSIEGLHTACPNNKGDWYFTGDYPTPGGFKVVNRAFINYMEDKDVRAY